jgi:hypothetical protein
MKRSTIKDTFGGEVPFTKFLAENKETNSKLLDAIDSYLSDEYSIVPEEHTLDNKRVDLVVRDSDGEISHVIESQDATGWLDSIHSTKITYYMYDRSCNDGVLLCEDASEHIKGYVKYLNENTPWRITLISCIVFDNKHVEFVPLMRPTNFTDKRVRVVSKNSDPASYETTTRICELYPGLFTNPTKKYVSTNNVGGTGFNVGLDPLKNGFNITMFHNGKYNNDVFRKSFTDLCISINEKPLFQKDKGYINGKGYTLERSIEIVKAFIDALEQDTMEYN